MAFDRSGEDPPLPSQRRGRSIKHPASTNFDDGQKGSSAKRLRRWLSTDGCSTSDSSTERAFIADTEDDGDEDDERSDRAPSEIEAEGERRDDEAPNGHGRQTDLESALPSIKTDEEAIEEYESRRAAEQTPELTVEERLTSRKSVKGRSSIYVDAFNLALETVLKDEEHLFDEAELAVFRHWKALSYEAQYL